MKKTYIALPNVRPIYYNTVLMRLFLLFLTTFLLTSCAFHKDMDMTVYTVSNGDFEDVLSVAGYVEPVKSVNIACPRNVQGVLTFLVEDGIHVNQEDVVCIIEVADLQTTYDQLLTDLENTKAHLNKTKADLDMQYALLEAQVKNNEADTRIAQLDSLQLVYVTPSQREIKKLELEKVAIEKVRYEKKLQALAIINQSEIRRIELEIQNLANRAQSAKEQLDALTLKSPQKGLATRNINPLTGKKFQVGDPVWGNMTLVSIPELEQMKVKIMASERDYKVINVNDSISYTFDAMPDNIGWGKILQKSPVGQQYKEGSKVKFFEIEASIDSVLKMPDPGFTTDCSIFLKHVKDTVVVPQVAVFEEDSIKVVYIKRDNGYEMRQIVQGLSSSRETIIAAGLRAEETISLIKPEASQIKNKKLLPDSIWKKQQH